MNCITKSIWLVAILLSISIALFAQPEWNVNPSRKHLQETPLSVYEPARADSAHGFDVQKYEISLSINDVNHFIEGDVLATVNAVDALSSISYEFVGLTVASVKVNGQVATYTHTGGILAITANIPAGQQFTTQVFYSGVPQLSANSYHLGMMFGNNTVFTISDPDAGRQWWPCYDHPWDKAIVDLHITMRSDWMVAANGLRSGITNNGNGTSTTHWLGSNPMTTYLVCITAGPYVEITQSVPSLNNLPIQNFVMQSQYNNAVIDLQNVPEMIRYFSSIFGAYPFEKYGHATVNMSTYSAMEHQTLTTLGNYILNGTQSYEPTIAHELAHQWFGNAVSFLTFKDVWLSEGFATYSEHLWADKRFGWQTACNYVTSNYHQYYLSWENSNGTPAIYNPSFYNYFSPPSYEKSASVLHMLRLKIGSANFFQLLQQWFTTYKHSNAVTAEFQAMAEQISGQDLQQFFSQWIYGTGIPSVEYSVWESEYISRVKIVAKTTSPTSTPFYVELPFRFTCGETADSLLVFASPEGQATEFLYGHSLQDCTITANYNDWAFLRQITVKKPVLTECLSSNNSVLLSWDVFQDGTDAGYLVYRRLNSSLPWVLLTDEPITSTSYQDNTPINNTAYQYAIKVLGEGAFTSQFSNVLDAMPQAFSFANDLLVVDETRDGNGSAISPNDGQVDLFYNDALQPLEYATWDCAAQGLPSLGTLGMYKVILWHADDYSQNQLQNNTGLIGGYILGGGKLLLSGWKTSSVFSTTFLDRFAGGITLNYDNGASLISVYSPLYPNMIVDPNKTIPAWNGMLSQIYTFNGAENSLFTATMNAGSAGADQCAALKFSSNGTLVLLGFPLYSMQAEGVRSFLQSIIPELISGTASDDEHIIHTPASISCSPNPFNPSTTVSYYNPQAGKVCIALYNLKGQKVRDLLVTQQGKGTHTLVFDGLDKDRHSLASGIYLLRFTYPQGEISKKITLMK